MMHDESTIDGVSPAGNTPESGGSSPHPGTRVPEYELLECIGEGGFGVVYRAKQTAPYRKEVAIKFIKKGRDTAAVLARFRQEQQALARMSHEGIAKIFDAGESEDGRPYFVMEFVRGEAITAYCDRHRLTLAERVELFARVCDAVHHAHSKGFIHRDLSPSNVLVQDIDGRPVPKIIDFGVAKALEAEADPGVVTVEGQPIGKYDYMSPEQAEMGRAGIDTRSDVYSLGVMLYELLTGALPIEVRHAVREEIPRLIRELEPARPSTRLTSIGDTASTVAADRQISVSGLRSRLRGELEWIPMRAIRKRPSDRYDSAAEFAKDLRNYLSGERLIAGPDSLGYQLRTVIRRHRAPFVLAGTAAACLAIGLTLAAVGFARAAHNARVAASTRTVLVDVILDSGATHGPDARLSDLLLSALRSPSVVDAEPSVRASLRAALVRGMLRLGALSSTNKAWASLSQDDTWQRALSEPERWEVLFARIDERLRSGAFDEVDRLLDEADSRAGGDDGKRRQVLVWRGNAAKNRARAMPPDRTVDRAAAMLRARAAYEGVAAEADRALGPGSEEAWTARYNLALLQRLEGDRDGATEAMRRLIETVNLAWKDSDQKWLQASTELASLLFDASAVEGVGEQPLDEAIALYEAVQAEQARVLGTQHWRRSETIINLALAYERRILRGGPGREADRARLAALLPVVLWGERSGGYLDVRGLEDPDTLSAIRLYLRMMRTIDQDGDAVADLERIAVEADEAGKPEAATKIRSIASAPAPE